MRQQRHLKFARHLQIFLHLRVFLAEFPGALGDALFELFIERAEVGLGLPARIPLRYFPQRPADRRHESREPPL